MERRRLGRTDIEVTPIGLGTWQFSESKGLAGRYWPALSQPLVDAIVKATLAGGIDWFDTAEAYGNGASEAAVSKALQANGVQPGEVVVATKWFPILRRAHSIETSFEDRKRFLAPFPVDLHQIHQAHGGLSSRTHQLEAMARLAQRGEVRAVGVSNYGAKAMREAAKVLERQGVGLATNQVKYSLLDRRIERKGVLDAARELGVTIIAYSPLEQGLVTGRFHDDPTQLKGPRKWLPLFRKSGLEKSRPVVEAVRDIARVHGVTPAQVALAWVVQFHGDTVVAIPGASKVSQAEQNAGALQVSLGSDELARLDEVSRPFL